MRNLSLTSRGFLALSCLLGLWTLPANAQQRKPWKIEQVRVGFQATKSQSEYAFKGGAWAPVYVDISAWPDRRVEAGKLIVESEDGDGVRNRYVVTLPAMEPGEMITVTGSFSIIASILNSRVGAASAKVVRRRPSGVSGP